MTAQGDLYWSCPEATALSTWVDPRGLPPYWEAGINDEGMFFILAKEGARCGSS